MEELDECPETHIDEHDGDDIDNLEVTEITGEEEPDDLVIEHFLGPRDGWQFLLAFALYSSLSIEALRGKKYWGPTTSSGHKPVYWNTGFTYYLMTMGFAVLLLLREDLPCFTIYRALPGFTVSLVIAGAFVSVLLFLMGTIDPSPGEFGVTGNIVFDFYWGIELYPRIGDRFDMKMWFNSRFGMMLWQLLVLACWKAQVDTIGWNWAMAASALLQSSHIAKFFWWEDLYMQSMDVTVDRGGKQEAALIVVHTQCPITSLV
ncbi:hypothetical protein MRX96_016370 [Rhipicephalus microplus]